MYHTLTILLIINLGISLTVLSSLIQQSDVRLYDLTMLIVLLVVGLPMVIILRLDQVPRVSRVISYISRKMEFLYSPFDRFARSKIGRIIIIRKK